MAGELGLNEGTLGNWVNADRRRRGEGTGALGEDERAELVRLHRHIFLILMYRRTSGSDLTTASPSAAPPTATVIAVM